MGLRISNVSQKQLNLLIYGGSVITLIFWPNLADPFNNPKSWALYIVGVYLGTWNLFQISQISESKVLRKTSVLTVAFVFFLLLSFIRTDEKYTGFFGENARRTGFLTYLCLSCMLISAALLIRKSNFYKLSHPILLVSSLLGGYGLLQHFNLDFISWNNPYNSVLSTLGNPDFASAAMSIFFVLTLGLCADGSKSIKSRIYSGVASVLLLATILFSHARQGILAAALGSAVIYLIWVWNRSKTLGVISLTGGAIVLIASIAGMLGRGPLVGPLYKESVSLRGDYWRAGLNMFKHSPWTGIGLDRYGAYFRLFRDGKQANRHSIDTVANAAHSVPIQLAATAGIFVFLSYVLLNIFIAWRGYQLIRISSGSNQIAISSVLGAWTAYQAQSLISIDNVGISIWGWILGGVIIGLSVDDAFENSNTKKKILKNDHSQKTNHAAIHILQPFISTLAVTCAVAIVIPLYLADSSVRMSRAYAKPSSGQEQAYISAVRKPLDYGIVDPYNEAVVGTILAASGQIIPGTELLTKATKADPRNYEAQLILAEVYEQTNQRVNAISTRRKMYELDPLNRVNLLALAEDLKNSGQLMLARDVANQIITLGKNSEEAKAARKRFL